MRRPRPRVPWLPSLALAALAFAPRAQGFLGVGDTSFVTVIANPAEAANWASELDALGRQLAAASATLQAVSTLRAYAGDPRAALGAMPDLADIEGALRLLASGGQTEEDLLAAWQAEGGAQRLLEAAALLRSSGPGSTMQVFGQEQARDPSLYLALARDAGASAAIRGQIGGEQAARASVASELAVAWSQFRAAPTESSKQAALTEISQLQSQSQVMDARRRALLDDLALSDRQAGTDAGVRARAADEQRLAESAQLNAGVAARAQDAQAQRLATLQKAVPAPPQADYSGVRLWTPADADGGPD